MTIGDFVWDDANGNGIQDAGEAGIGAVTVGLYDTSNHLVDHTATAGDGSYHFIEAPGTYTVQVDTSTLLAGFVPTATLQGGNTAVDSNTNPSGTTPATLGAGQSDLSVDFGYDKPVTIGDFVWNDLNSNGIQDSGEAGIAGVTLTLTGTDITGAAVTDHATTNANGNYLFTEVPGTYTVTVDATNSTGIGALVGFTPTATLQGTNRAIDSNPSLSGTTPADLPSGGSDLTIDFGYVQPSSPVGKGQFATIGF